MDNMHICIGYERDRVAECAGEGSESTVFDCVGMLGQ